jgi:hypothetical protein
MKTLGLGLRGLVVVAVVGLAVVARAQVAPLLRPGRGRGDQSNAERRNYGAGWDAGGV